MIGSACIGAKEACYHYKGEENVGVYSIAAFIATIIETPLNSLERIAHSKIAHFYAGNNLKEIKDIYFKSSRYLMLIGGLLTVLVIINVKDGELVASPTGQPTSVLLAEKEDFFFLRSPDIQIDFTRDDKKVVNGFILHQNGNNIKCNKIK